MFVLDYEILGMRSLRVFHLVRSRLDPVGRASGERHSRLSRPRWDATALGGRARPRRGGRAAAEVRRLREGEE